MGTTVEESEKHALQTNMQDCVGSDVTLYLRQPEELEPLGLPLEEGVWLDCRLVGADRQGAWFEPTAWLEEARDKGDEVVHIFLRWENVLSIFLRYPSDRAIARKQYRGLRPR